MATGQSAQWETSRKLDTRIGIGPVREETIDPRASAAPLRLSVHLADAARLHGPHTLSAVLVAFRVPIRFSVRIIDGTVLSAAEKTNFSRLRGVYPYSILFRFFFSMYAVT